MEDDRAFLTWQERLRAAMHQWAASGNDDGALWRGAPLADAEDWQQQRLAELSPAQRIFIQLSLALRDREEKEKEARRQRELKQQKTMTWLATIAAVLMLAALVAGRFAWQQQQQAEQALQAFFLRIDPPKPELLKKLPDYLQKADKLRNMKKGKDKNKNVDLALAYYRGILRGSTELQKLLEKSPQIFHNPDRDRKEILKIKVLAESSLVETVRSERLPQLNADLMKGKVGSLKHNPNLNYTDRENQYTDGALKTTYKILMLDIGADLNESGVLENENELKIMPCLTLKEIETIWRKWTSNRCGWYGIKDEFTESACKELKGETLTALIFVEPFNENAVNRLKFCEVAPEPTNKNRYKHE
jgi:hypothetical protein